MKARQQSIATGPECKHLRIRKVENYANEVIAEFCSACGVKLWERGHCNGCDKPNARVTQFVSKRSGWLRFCDGTCHTAYLEAEKEAKRALRPEVSAR